MRRRPGARSPRRWPRRPMPQTASWPKRSCDTRGTCPACATSHPSGGLSASCLRWGRAGLGRAKRSAPYPRRSRHATARWIGAGEHAEQGLGCCLPRHRCVLRGTPCKRCADTGFSSPPTRPAVRVNSAWSLETASSGRGPTSARPRRRSRDRAVDGIRIQRLRSTPRCKNTNLRRLVRQFNSYIVRQASGRARCHAIT